MTSYSAVCSVRVGRDDELAFLEGAASTKTTTLIAGEAGVGKSRLASEALRLAGDLGLAKLVGHCSQGPSVPYLPFVSAVRRHVRTWPEEDVFKLFDGPALLSAALLPEVGRAIGLPATPPPQEDLFAAVWQLVHRLASPSGCVLLLEDVHWADSDSLRLFSYLAHEATDLGAWLLATYRVDELHRRHPLTGALAELRRERLCEEVRLGSLAVPEVRAMAAAILGGAEVTDDFAVALAERTGGNPFFIEELLKVLIERRPVGVAPASLGQSDLTAVGVPVTVREALLSRAREMTDVPSRVLQFAAFAGHYVDPPVISRAAGVTPEEVDAALREGLALQLLTERQEGRHLAYGFRHALTREAVMDEVVGPDRQRVHRRLAEAIASAHAGNLDPVAAQLADHYGKGNEPEKAAEFATRAARLAGASCAYEEAANWYDRALSLQEGDPRERLALLLEAAEVAVEAPDRRLAAAFATEARRLARAGSDRLSESRALGVLEHCAWEAGDTSGAIEGLQRAVSLAQGRDDFQEANLLARLARLFRLADKDEEAARVLPALFEVAEKSGNFRALSHAHGTRMLMAGEDRELEDAFARALAAAQAGEDPKSARNVTSAAGYMWLWRGDLERSRSVFARARELHARDAPHERYVDAGYAWLLSLLGEYDEAARLARPLRSVPSVPTRIVALTALFEVAAWRGEPDASALADELWSLAAPTGESQRSVPALAARARAAVARSGPQEAGPLFWDAMSGTRTRTGAGSHWMFSPDFAKALAEEGQLAELERWDAAVAELTRGDPNRHNLAAACLVRGFCLLASGDHAGGRAAFSEAAGRYGSLPCPARQAEALIGLAQLEWAVDDPPASAQAAREALAIADRTGAASLLVAAQEALDRAETSSVLATVLFTDIVGSTARAAAMGDRSWSSLLERHNALARKEFARWKGRELDNPGDGFLVMFQTPAHAIRCALAVRDAVAGLGIEVRAGLHTGECQVSGKTLAGIAVHIAARVCAGAGAGEVLVSGTVRELVAGSTFRFSDRGAQVLKGVPGTWQLFSVG